MAATSLEFRAALEAKKVLAERHIASFPVDPFAIAASESIYVEAKPATLHGVSGMLVRVGDSYAIVYATHVESQGFQRFSIAHELGHYFMPGHLDHVLPAGASVHESRAGFVSKDRYELEADHFAANLLMPNPRFANAAAEAGEGLAAVRSLAELCQTSMTATAIRFAQHADIPVAVVVSTGTTIDYCFVSDPLKEVRGLEWIRKQTPLPRDSATYAFNGNPSNVKDGLQTEGVTALEDWFGGTCEAELLEEVIGLGSYEKTLTVLSGSDIPDQEELEDEDELEDSWRPKFHR